METAKAVVAVVTAALGALLTLLPSQDARWVQVIIMVIGAGAVFLVPNKPVATIKVPIVAPVVPPAHTSATASPGPVV
jgi:hypothetical protein